MPQPDLADLDAFVAVARARSFRGAAALRGVSASALSEALRRLEARLGARLLNRTTRSVTPTEAGARLLERLGPALGEVAAAIDAVGGAGDDPAGTLRLNAPSVVARYVLPDIAARFLRAHPGVRLEVETNDSFVDVFAGGFDAGIRYEEHLERDMIALPIGPRVQRFVLAAAPAYLDARGAPQHPHDLLAHACIRHRFPSGVTPPWEFGREGQTLRVSPPGPLTAATPDLGIAAARSGLGLVWMFAEYLRADLDAGRLVAVMEPWSLPFSGPRLYYPSRRLMPGPLRAFVDVVRGRPGTASATARLPGDGP